MNNSIIALNPIMTGNNGQSNGEIKYINGNCLSMPISNVSNNNLDQNQMMQIQQFLNDLQQQQQPIQQQQPQQNILAAAESLSLNDLNQQQSLQNLLDIVVTSPTSSQQQQSQQQNYYQQSNQQQNSLILSPNSIIKLDTQQYVNNQQQIFIQQNQQQQVENQVHTIMLNGQPALFIPASSVMSNNLLSQMLMNTNQNTTTNQVYSEQIGLPIQLHQLPQQQNVTSNNQQNNLTNEFTLQTDTNEQQQHQVINLAQVLNSNDTNSLQYLQLSNHHQQNNEIDSQQIVCKIEQDLVQPVQQQQHFILHNANTASAAATTTTQITTNNNTSDQTQLGQQIICIQPDGNITFQTLPFLIQQPQQQQQQNDHTVNNNNITKVTKTKISKPKITPTVASVLMSPDKLKAKLLKDDLQNKSNGKKSVNNKVAIILNSNENKLKQDEQPIRIDMQSPQQWVFMNGSCIDGQVIINNSDSASSSSKNDNENTVTIDSIYDSQNGGIKRKRKACDCPNCLKYRENSLTPEELTKKRTHKCHKCTKEYNKTSHLRAHLRAHDNYRPYVCDFKTCGKSFTRSDELKRHKRIHNDDRNFPCSICKKKFLRSDHLNKHLLIHNKPIVTDGNQENKQNKSAKKGSNTIKKIKLEQDSSSVNTINLNSNQLISNISSSASSSSTTSTE